MQHLVLTAVRTTPVMKVLGKALLLFNKIHLIFIFQLKYVFIRSLFNDAGSNSEHIAFNDGMRGTNILRMIWKFLRLPIVLWLHLPGQT